MGVSVLLDTPAVTGGRLSFDPIDRKMFDIDYIEYSESDLNKVARAFLAARAEKDLGEIEVANGLFARDFLAFYQRETDGLPVAIRAMLFKKLKSRLAGNWSEGKPPIYHAAKQLRSYTENLREYIEPKSFWLMDAQQLESKVSEFLAFLRVQISYQQGKPEQSDAEQQAIAKHKELQSTLTPEMAALVNQCLHQEIERRAIDNRPLTPELAVIANECSVIESQLNAELQNAIGSEYTINPDDADEIEYQNKLIKLASSVVGWCASNGINSPFSQVGGVAGSSLEVVFSKLMDEQRLKKWFYSQAERKREHVEIVIGNVHKRKCAYCSPYTLAGYRFRRNSQREWMGEMSVVCDEKELSIDMLNAWEKSIANPANKRRELMTRISGIETAAQKQGLTGVMITITAPSKYHAMKTVYKKIGSNKKKKIKPQVVANPKYNGATPRETSLYLNQVWQRTRAKLHRQEINIIGIRVAEPHHDGTPHWHILTFVERKNIKALKQVVKQYATAEDMAELMLNKTRSNPQHKAELLAAAKKYGRGINQNYAVVLDTLDRSMVRKRCDFKILKRRKLEDGSYSSPAAAYVAKYVAKNIDGAYVGKELDHETGKKISDTIDSVRAWASVWGIRQFQFIGGAPVGMWREVRRFINQKGLENRVTKYLEILGVDVRPLFAAADDGDYEGFLLHSGGLFQGADGVLSGFYEESENEFGEVNKTLVGFTIEDIAVNTHKDSWRMAPAIRLPQSRQASRCPVSNCTKIKPANHWIAGVPSSTVGTETPNKENLTGHFDRMRKEKGDQRFAWRQIIAGNSPLSKNYVQRVYEDENKSKLFKNAAPIPF